MSNRDAPRLSEWEVGFERQGFTLHYDLTAREIITPVGVSGPYGPGLDDASPARPRGSFDGLWDTGATCSVVSSRIVAELMLEPIDRNLVETASGTYDASVYLVAVYLPGSIAIPAVRVIDSPSIGGADVLIGMDIIGSGDFAVTNLAGRTSVSFQTPSTHRVDFADDRSNPDE